jgi:hypothetical protein
MSKGNYIVIILGISLTVAGLSSSAFSQSAVQEMSTIFTTENWLEDRELWTNPAYFRNNTPVNLEDMGEGVIVYGEAGDLSIDIPREDLISPYPYQSSDEHFQALLEAAGGGTVHTRESLPDWSGYWGGGRNWLNMRTVQASTIVSLLSPEYQEFYVQQLKAEAEARAWWPAAFCLPESPTRFWTRGVGPLFQVTPQAVAIIHPNFSQANIGLRWIETTGEGHTPEELYYPNFMGESVGFWDGDVLIVHTNQLRGWLHGHGELEYSDELTLVERYQRAGDVIEAELTLYDPIAFVQPLHTAATLNLRETPTTIPWAFCSSSIGPSINTYFDEDGFLQERSPMDPMWWDPTEPRPWGRIWEQMPVSATPPAQFID